MALTGGYSFTVTLADEEATRRLMVDITEALRPGDTLTLSGDLGAGLKAHTTTRIMRTHSFPNLERRPTSIDLGSKTILILFAR